MAMDVVDYEIRRVLCAARGVSLGIAFQRKLSVGFFGGDDDSA